MADAFAIEEDFEVLSSDNRHVGEVDGLTDDGLRLSRRDSEAGGRHHLIPIDMIERVAPEERKVFLNCTQEETERRWIAAD